MSVIPARRFASQRPFTASKISILGDSGKRRRIKLQPVRKQGVQVTIRKGRISSCKIRPFTLQKAANQTVKGDLLQDERRVIKTVTRTKGRLAPALPKGGSLITCFYLTANNAICNRHDDRHITRLCMASQLYIPANHTTPPFI